MQEDTPKKAVSLSALQAADLYRMQVRELRGYAMFMLDPQGIITSWNAGVEHLWATPKTNGSGSTPL